MKLLPALRGKTGIWNYYVCNLKYHEVAQFVRRIDNELHTSAALSSLIQRSITDNYKSIKKYIIEQDERFFNSLVLAVYDGDPEWIEVELNYDEKEFFNLGFLKLSGNEIIFPVDGQHRVEGIKKALEEKNDLSDETIPAIFIGHKKTAEGIERTRRIFSTLNRYAKPVSMRDIIALDEDDIVAIVTRELVEKHDLFKGSRTLDSRGKPIPESNKSAITSIITLYDCNKELFKYFKNDRDIKGNLNTYLKLRPDQEVIDSFNQFCQTFWDDFKDNLNVISSFLGRTNEPAAEFRNKENGGHLLFRPIGLLPFICSVLEIHKRNGELNYKDIFTKFNDISMSLNSKPWKQIIWNDVEKKIIGSDNTLIRLLLMYLFDKQMLKENELERLLIKYKGKIGYEGAETDLDTLIQD
ncbi:DNA sulfur modification protein DndB [Sutcliffiella cohnii]|uniref:DNA sulfur modification protein DndB n=1 Tax=Sutcliffiella cohnii TaxID=33932 RepID=UPI002E2471ED|nr:DNA sulfur modification protein DndB [Sutcliffiella cohnii]